jgi:hypothetical protein
MHEAGQDSNSKLDALLMRLSADHREMIIDEWGQLGRAPVDARILVRIQTALGKLLGSDAVPSPAFIARVLADEGAELRHPEVIECDARWREKRVKHSDLNARHDSTAPLTLKDARTLLQRFEVRRRELSLQNDADELRRLRDAGLNEKAKAQLLARDPSLSESLRQQQQEIGEWFRVWLQTPEIFEDWLDLRQRSQDFRQMFGVRKS